MGQSLAKLYVHMIFSTKGREPFIAASVQDELHAYTAAILHNLECPAIQIGGTANHLHILAEQSKNVATREWAEKIKAASSKWIKTKGAEFQHFYWQGGYAAFSVSASNVEKVQRYIVNQAEHHRVKTFEEELREFFNQYAVEYDERFVWD